MIYIHSKLLIVDDTQVLISSANINDRSMIGNRDSEFGVLIEEEKNEFYLMNGNNDYEASKFAVGLRKKLMSEHLGIDIEFMISLAKNNTQIYKSIFRCYPDDDYTTFELLSKAKKMSDEEWNDVLLNKYMRMKNQILGNIVEFPLNFLKDEKLGKIIEYVDMPEKAFT